MDMKQYKVLSFPKSPEVNLLGNLVMPSTLHAYSLCVEYIKQWFVDILQKTNGKDFIKPECIYVDGKHLYDDFIRMNNLERLKIDRPSLAIVPRIDHSYDRDGKFTKVLGIENYIKRGSMYRGFFNDFNNNLHLNVEMKSIQVEFNMTLRLATRAQQMDIAEMLKIACRIGWTGGEYKDLDFHVPYQLMMQLAKDAGFKVTNNTIDNPMRFLRYLNSHSSVPFIYKTRGVNGKKEFFLRIKSCYIHTRYNSIDVDDGERMGQTSTNYNISFNFLCTFPAPNFYLYYSEYKNDIPVGIETYDSATTMAAYAIKITRFPDIDENGWDLSMTADVEERDHSKPLTIDLNELFQNDSDYNDILFMIKQCKDTYINPSIFLNFKLYNMGEPIPCNVDWDKMELTSNTILKGDINNFAIYVNYQYLNEQLAVTEDYYNDRIR